MEVDLQAFKLVYFSVKKVLCRTLPETSDGILDTLLLLIQLAGMYRLEKLAKHRYFMKKMRAQLQNETLKIREELSFKNHSSLTKEIDFFLQHYQTFLTRENRHIL